MNWFDYTEKYHDVLSSVESTIESSVSLSDIEWAERKLLVVYSQIIGFAEAMKCFVSVDASKEFLKSAWVWQSDMNQLLNNVRRNVMVSERCFLGADSPVLD